MKNSRPSSKRRRSSKEQQHGSFEEDISALGIPELQTSQLPRIPEERAEDQPSPPTAAAAREISFDGVEEVTQIPQMVYISLLEINSQVFLMNSMKLVIPLHSLYWSIHTKDESKCETAFAFIFGVN